MHSQLVVGPRLDPSPATALGHQLWKAEEEPGTGLRLSKVGGSAMCKGPAQLALTSDHPGMFVGSAQGLAGDGRACR